MKKFILSASALLLLSGCVSQDQADAKLARGCEAGIQALIRPVMIKEVKSKNFSFEENAEGQHRAVKIDTITKDGWLELEKSYICVFAQQWGLFKSSHGAILMQIRMPDGKIIGKKDNKIVGNMDQFLKLTETVQASMKD